MLFKQYPIYYINRLFSMPIETLFIALIPNDFKDGAMLFATDPVLRLLRYFIEFPEYSFIFRNVCNSHRPC